MIVDKDEIEYTEGDWLYCLNIAYRMHKGQTDKAGVPYFEHLQAVANSVSTNFEKCVAYLHDVLEDTDMTVKILEKLTNNKVSTLVQDLSKSEHTTYDEYIDWILKGDDSAVNVKIADLKHNMDLTRLDKITDKDVERVKKYHKAYLKLSNR